MKLWLLRQSDDHPIPYGNYNGFVICAETEQDAREIAKSFTVADYGARWLDSEQTIGVEITAGGEPGVVMYDIDLTAWEYGGDAICPNCQDETLYIGIRPVWATDQCELYEVMCPVCGVIGTDGDVLDNEEMDLWHADMEIYRLYRPITLPPYEA